MAVVHFKAITMRREFLTTFGKQCEVSQDLPHNDMPMNVIYVSKEFPGNDFNCIMAYVKTENHKNNTKLHRDLMSQESFIPGKITVQHTKTVNEDHDLSAYVYTVR
jgi:hypothetical protein